MGAAHSPAHTSPPPVPPDLTHPPTQFFHTSTPSPTRPGLPPPPPRPPPGPTRYSSLTIVTTARELQFSAAAEFAWVGVGGERGGGAGGKGGRVAGGEGGRCRRDDDDDDWPTRTTFIQRGGIYFTAVALSSPAQPRPPP